MEQYILLFALLFIVGALCAVLFGEKISAKMAKKNGAVRYQAVDFSGESSDTP